MHFAYVDEDPYNTFIAHTPQDINIALRDEHGSQLCQLDVHASLAELLAVLAEPAYADKELALASLEQCIVREDDVDGAFQREIACSKESWRRHECEPPPPSAGNTCEEAAHSVGGCLTCRPGGVIGEARVVVGTNAGTTRKAGTVRKAKSRYDKVTAARARDMRVWPEVQTTEDVGAIVKRIKMEERKVRNRESAHRSNERKRAVKAVLEKELGKERLKVCELRLRERRLREENGSLRATIELLFSPRVSGQGFR